LFKKFPEWHKISQSEYQSLINNLNIITSYKETWETIDNPRPKIVIAGSGMVTGGRVLTYLQQLIDEPSTSILLVGYQAEGTRGRKLLDGYKEIKIYGKYYSVNAQVHLVESLSAHADQSELLNWVSNIVNIPEKVFLIHGDPEPLAVLKAKLEMVHRWNVSKPHINFIQEFIVR